nr:GGDEF domain-containing protein [Oceanococcus sp. HetDA_MAG_MS8]
MQVVGMAEDRGERLGRRFLLRFATPLESKFVAEYEARRLFMVRLGLLIAALMYVGYALVRGLGEWDRTLLHTSMLRGVIIISMLAVYLVLERIQGDARRWLIALNYVLFTACLAAIEGLNLAAGEVARYEGMIFIVFHCLVLSGLLLRHAVLVVAAIYVLYAVLMPLSAISTENLIYQLFFLFLTIALGFCAQYLVESRERESWLRQRSLESQARIDPVTGLYNRAAFEQRLPQRMDQARTAEEAVCLVLLDVDHFKQVNDVAGHAVGDQVLEAVGQHMQAKGHHPRDLSARWGGDEFVALWHCARLDILQQRFEQLQTALQGLERQNQQQPIAVSIGAVVIPPEVVMQASECLQLADEQLYAAKAAGRRTWRLKSLQQAG